MKVRAGTLAFFLAVCLAGFSWSLGQSFVVHHGIKSGLPSQWVYHGAIDADGYVWFGTRSGVTRFDGYAFENYSTEDGLANNDVFRIVPDSSGRLWLTTMGQLSYWENGSFQLAPFAGDLQGKEMRWIQAYQQGVVMAVGNPEEQRWEFLQYPGVDGPSANVETLAVSTAPASVNLIPNRYLMVLDNKEIWASSVDFHYAVHAGLKDSIARPASRRGSASGFPSQTHGELFFAEGGIAAFDGKSVKTLIPTLPGVETIETGWSIFEDSKQRLWVASKETGLMAITIKSSAPFEVASLRRFPDVRGRISSILEDREGNMFITTLGKGIYFIPHYVDFLEELLVSGPESDWSLQSLLLHSNGDLYAGRSDNRIVRLHSDEVQSIELPGNPSQRVTSIVEIDGDHVLAGGPAITLLNLASGQQKHFTDACIKDMYRSRDTVWIASCSRELAIPIADLQQGNLPFGEHLDAYAKDNGRSNAVFYDEATGIRWRGDFYGLSAVHFPDGKPVSKAVPEEIAGTPVFDIQKGKSGLIWVATDGKGLVVFDPESGEHRQIQHRAEVGRQLGSNTCRQICPDEQGNVWVATDRGLDLIRSFDFEQNTYEILHLDATHGLPSDDVNAVVSRPDSGWVYVATDKGLSRVDLGLLDILPDQAPKAIISRIRINGKTINTEDVGTFRHDQNELTIEYSGLSYASQGKLRYAIQLLGADTQSDTVEFRVANYRNLPPGSYTFQVWACNHNGIWSATPAEWHFEIQPHFTQTWWFWLLIIGLSLFLLWSLYLYRLRKVRQNARLRADLELKMIELERSALQAQMNPHFISNVLGSVQHFILRRDTDPLLAADYLADFSRLIRMILDHSRTAWISLQEEVDFLSLYLSMEKLRLPEKLNYQLDLDPDLDPAQTLMPAMLVQPYVENAIQHGIRHLENPGQLDVKIKPYKTGISIEVKDNGIGRVASAALKNRDISHRSHGTSISEERIAAINASGKALIHIDIQDLDAAANENKGTIVTIYMEKTYAKDSHHRG